MFVVCLSQVQVRGRKRWHLCHPDNEPYMYGAGRVNCFNPDYRNFPLMKKASCFLDTVR